MTADDVALLDAYSQAVMSAVDRVGPAVVKVEVDGPPADGSKRRRRGGGSAIPRRLSRACGLDGVQGLGVTAVSPDSPAARAGLHEGDVIVDFDGAPVAGADDLPRLLTDDRIDRAVSLRLLRRGEHRTVDIVPA